MLLMIGVDNVDRRSKTKARRKMIANGVAGRSMVMVYYAFSSTG